MEVGKQNKTQRLSAEKNTSSVLSWIKEWIEKFGQ